MKDDGENWEQGLAVYMRTLPGGDLYVPPPEEKEPMPAVDINQVTLSGTLTGETREADVGDSHVVNRELTFTTRGKDDATKENYIELQGWGQIGDELARSAEGEIVIIAGSLVRKAWKNKDDEWQSKHSIRVSQIQEMGPALSPAGQEDASEEKLPFE